MGEKGNIAQGVAGLSERLHDAAGVAAQTSAGAEPAADSAAKTGGGVARALVTGVAAAKLTKRGKDDEDETGEAGPPV
jgi:hypothetical protein